PLRVNNVTNDSQARRDIDHPVEGQILLYPSVGLEVLRRVGFNVMLPIVPYQFTGEDPVTSGVGSGGLTGTNSALMDLRLDLRILAWESDDRRTRFGTGGALWLPVGSSSGFGS